MSKISDFSRPTERLSPNLTVLSEDIRCQTRCQHYRASQGITLKNAIFSIISFLNYLKFNDEERNELSLHPLVMHVL